MKIDAFADPIWTAMENGLPSLKNVITRSYVNDALHQDEVANAPGFDERGLMKQCFLVFIDNWPSETTTEHRLPALGEMRRAMNVDEINQHVAVFPDPSRMKDGRQSLAEFTHKLKELVLHEWDQPESGEGN